MRRLRYLFLFLLFALKSFAQADLQDCAKKIKTDWGVDYSSVCGSPTTNSYTVYLKNVCAKKIDVVCAVLDNSKEWKRFYKAALAPNDTMIGFACDGAGKFKCFVKPDGDPSLLPTYEELNEEYLKLHPKPPLTGMKPQGEKKYIDMYAKVLFGEIKKEPLANQSVSLKNSKGEVVQKVLTDQFGDFNFKQLEADNKYEIYLEKNNRIGPNEHVYLARQNGTLLKEFLKDAAGNFKYEVLPADVVKLSTIDDVEDPYLVINDFKKSTKTEITIADNIYYEAGAWEVKESIAKELDKVVKILQENKNMSVELNSYTDAKGDDNINLDLSQKRSKSAIDYIVSKGIAANRVGGKGLGETKILNRCKNGVDCSDKEHQLNRRTEFKFIKK